MTDINDKHWEKFIRLMESGLGVAVTPEQEKILRARLDKLCIQYAVNSYERLYHILTDNPPQGIWDDFVEGIIFRPAGFFKENHYLEFIVDQTQMILEENKRIRQNGEIRVWSIGCSTGEEPYALAIILQECLPLTVRVKILATDIHAGTLITASSGLFGSEIGSDVSPYLRDKYFKEVADGYEIKPETKRLVTFRLFNPLQRYSFKSNFDIIFCQNGLVYYDNAMRLQLIEKFYQKLHVGGLLLAGHSQDLLIPEDHFRRLEPTVYIK